MISIKNCSLGLLGANCYVITDSASGESAVVDPGGYDKRIDRILSEIGYKNVKYILLTHGHFDHTDGANEILKRTSAKVAIGKDDAGMLSNEDDNLSNPFAYGESEPVKYDILLSDGDILKLGESEIKVITTPGHSRGSVTFMCENKLFTGDTLFKGAIGRTDFPSSSYAQMQESLVKLSQLQGDYEVFPGHDNKTTLNNERKSNPYLRYITP
ncbi:MAG: MBL fold metallo-hydrolase [Acutalibacteraceae bacterium]|nr:MBL fold metallo-hydrolase [Clostridia bacterium]MEE3449428.1 MBL fold metallo-hydrolase [Acutalibacteraceae bacterium]